MLKNFYQQCRPYSLRQNARLTQFEHRSISTLRLKQLLVRALLNNAALLHDNNAVSILNGGQSMGDHQRGPVFAGFEERLAPIALTRYPVLMWPRPK